MVTSEFFAAVAMHSYGHTFYKFSWLDRGVKDEIRILEL